MKALLLLLALVASTAQASNTLIDHLQSVSVTIKSGTSQGSGVLFTRGERTFVWTAAHVIDNLRKTHEIVVEGVKKTVIDFSDAQIVQEFRQDGRRIGVRKMDCKVIRYSHPINGEGLALLEVRKRNFTDATVVFYKGETPSLGIRLYHVGSPRGQFGAHSLTTGVVAQIDRVFDGLGTNGTIFDQTTCTSQPGSSGGGVFLQENGQYIGMLVRGGGEQFNLVVPVRRLRAWAEEADVMWAVDPSVPLPSSLEDLPIEDSSL